LDTLLTSLRRVIAENGSNGFPVEKIEAAMASRGKSLHFVEEEIEELSELEYGGKRTFALLSILFPGFDFSHHFHVDHIYPRSRFSVTKLRKLGIAEEEIPLLTRNCNRLANLQLLEGTINNEKRQKMPADWYEIMWPNQDARNQHLQSQAVSHLVTELRDFNRFYDERHAILKVRISTILNG
jgi:hypothetical protein